MKVTIKSRFDRYSVKNSVLIISHITFQDCRVYICSDNLSRNSCMRGIGGKSGPSCSKMAIQIGYPEKKLYVVFVVGPGLDSITLDVDS